ncbi:MAG: hypothetical protein J5449_07195 [Oscillospiraceae bacterium]|nr:hypothetical protein [Oscillospiraceae bacterium]
MKKRKTVLMLISVVAGVIVIAAAAAAIRLSVMTNRIGDDYSSVFGEDKYKTPVNVESVEVITQKVSCGYAVIEMFSHWSGGNVTEEKLYETYGKVVTSTGRAFCEEMNKQFPQYQTTMRKWLKNTELIELLYENLSAGVPVPFEWAALYGDVWTLHYSLVTGMDIPNNTIRVANPYGYYEELSVNEFLRRTSFEAYENMPLFLKLGFAFGIFEKNTIYGVSSKTAVR